MHTDQVNSESGGEHDGTAVQMLDGFTEEGSGRGLAVLAGFKIGSQLGTGPTEAQDHLP